MTTPCQSQFLIFIIEYSISQIFREMMLWMPLYICTYIQNISGLSFSFIFLNECGWTNDWLKQIKEFNTSKIEERKNNTHLNSNKEYESCFLKVCWWYADFNLHFFLCSAPIAIKIEMRVWKQRIYWCTLYFSCPSFILIRTSAPSQLPSHSSSTRCTTMFNWEYGKK